MVRAEKPKESAFTRYPERRMRLMQNDEMSGLERSKRQGNDTTFQE